MHRKKLIALLCLGSCYLILSAIPSASNQAHAAISGQAPSGELAAVLPDLALDGFTMTPAQPKVNEPVTFATTVRNIGAGEGPGWRVNLYIDPTDQPPTTTTTEDNTLASFVRMPAGSSASIEFSNYTFTTPGCQHVVYAWADPRQGIPESDETNNLRAINVCVDPAQTTQPGADSYEPDNPCSATIPSIPTDGTTQARNFTPVGDEDYARFQVTKGVTYVVTAVAAGSDALPGVSVSDSCTFPSSFCSVTSRVDGSATPACSPGPRQQFVALIDGTYYLKVENNALNPDPTRTVYYLSVSTLASVSPILSRVIPSQIYSAQPTDLHIYGSNFTSGITLTVGTLVLEPINVIDSTHAVATLPTGLAPGRYDLIVYDPNGGSNRLSQALTVLESLRIYLPIFVQKWEP